MKRILIAVLIGAASFSSLSTKAQVSVNINIGTQPQWGPSGYNHVDYYYLPDVDAYYNVSAKQFIYLNNGSWIWRTSLPSRYSNFDLYNAYKVVMNTPKPYLSHQTHVREYQKYKGYSGRQTNLRDKGNNRGQNNSRGNSGNQGNANRGNSGRNTSGNNQPIRQIRQQQQNQQQQKQQNQQRNQRNDQQDQRRER